MKITAILLAVLGTIIVAVRLYARTFITRAPGIDDILIVIALAFGIGLSAVNVLGAEKYYTGYHVWDIPASGYVPHRINAWLGQLFFTLSLSFTKISVLLFYRRLSVSFTDKFLIAVWVGIIYNILYAFGFVLTLCLLCRPLPAYWLSFDAHWAATHHHTCGSEQIADPLSGIFSSIGDIYSALLPMILISRLQLPRRQKMALYFLFSLAFLVVITGFVRIAYLYRTVNVTYDFTWTLWKAWMLCQIELWMALFAASAPALKPLFKSFFAHLSSSMKTGSGVEMTGHATRGRRTPSGIDVERYVELTSEEKSRHSVGVVPSALNGTYSAKVEAILGPKEKSYFESTGKWKQLPKLPWRRSG